jgi:predicted nucleic acid-binding protein
MPVVSNTSPILNLAIINQLDLLRQQFGEVLIPPAVQTELKVETQFPGTTVVRQALQGQWLRVVEPQDVHLARVLAFELDQGEAATIALAVELSAEQVLMDERDGRAKAKAMGLQPVGVLGVLLRAKRAGNLDSVRVAMQALRGEAGFFVADDLFMTILIDAGEY